MSKWEKNNDINQICRLIVIVPIPDDEGGSCRIVPPVFVRFWA